MASSSSGKGDDEVSSEVLAVQFGLRLRSCLRDATSVWKQPQETSLVRHDHMSKLRLDNPKGSLPLVKPKCLPWKVLISRIFNKNLKVCRFVQKWLSSSARRGLPCRTRNVTLPSISGLRSFLRSLLRLLLLAISAGKASGACAGNLGGCPGLQGKCNLACKGGCHALVCVLLAR